ncbi:hypothetical protein B0H11DRAFT_1933527 [Mycena galericulata]|nr:hypothetical protein B0H11DRAFT_1933527 [Mycena galericulata]
MPPGCNPIPSQPKNIPPKVKPPPKASERIRSAILACILDPKYCPPAFPPLEDLFGPDSFSKTEEGDEGASAAERDYYAQIGPYKQNAVHEAAWLSGNQQSWSLSKSEITGPREIEGSNPGKAAFRRVLVGITNLGRVPHCSAFAVPIGKINPKLLDKVSKVEGGCHALVGALWIQFGEDTERVARWLGPIFWPLLEAAGDEIIKMYNFRRWTQVDTDQIYSSDEKEKEIETNAASTRKRRVPADLQFLLNLREAQDDAVSHQCPSSPALESKNSAASHACDQNKLEVERNEFVSIVDQDEFLDLGQCEQQEAPDPLRMA